MLDGPALKEGREVVSKEGGAVSDAGRLAEPVLEVQGGAVNVGISLAPSAHSVQQLLQVRKQIVLGPRWSEEVENYPPYFTPQLSTAS